MLKYFSKDKKFNSALQEISENIIKGNVKVSPYKKRKLKQFKDNIYSLAYSKRIPPKQIVQSGGWLWVIPLVAQTIGSLLK